MDLSKFVAILQTNSLVFARAVKLGDPFEGSVPKRGSPIGNIRPLPPGHVLHEVLTEDTLRQISEFTSKVNRDARLRIYLSCWHMNDRECAAMWKLYSQSRDAIAIKTTYASLASVLPNQCKMGLVQYIDYNVDLMPATENVITPFVHKRASFSHEREARAIICEDVPFFSVDTPLTKAVPIDVSVLVQNVFVAPTAPNWFKDVVVGLCGKYHLQVPVHKSELDAKPIY